MSNRLLVYIILASYIICAIIAGWYHNFILTAVSIVLFFLALFISVTIAKRHPYVVD